MGARVCPSCGRALSQGDLRALEERFESTNTDYREAKGVVSEMEREIGEIDWGAKEKEIREELEAARREIDEAADGASEKAKEGYQALREQMDHLTAELEELGRSEQARELRERIEKLFGAEAERN